MLHSIGLPLSCAGLKRHCLIASKTGCSNEASVDLSIVTEATLPSVEITTIAMAIPSIPLGFTGATLFLTDGCTSHLVSAAETVFAANAAITRIRRLVMLDLNLFMILFNERVNPYRRSPRSVSSSKVAYCKQSLTDSFSKTVTVFGVSHELKRH